MTTVDRNAESFCRICDKPVALSLLIHNECKLSTLVDVSERKLCKHFARTGLCTMGDSCYFRHYRQDNDPQVTNQKAQRGYNRRRIRNKSRATVFRKFLINTFGLGMLNSGSGVLDVAAGRGLLSYELLNLNDISTLRIEPRRTRAGRRFKFLLEKGAFHRNKDIGQVTSTFGSNIKIPQQLRICLDRNFVSHAKVGTLTQDIVDEYVERADCHIWNKKGLQPADGIGNIT